MLEKVKTKFRLNGLTNRHDLPPRELSMEETEWLGDVKSLLGYAHVGYKTDPIFALAWWKEK